MTPVEWSGRRLLPLVVAPAMGLLAVAEARLDPVYRADTGPLLAVAAWLTGALALAAGFPAFAVPVVAAYYPVGVLLDAPGPGGAGLISLLLAAGWAGYASADRRSLLGVSVAVAVFVVTDAVVHGVGWDTIFFPVILFPAWWSGTLVRRERARSTQLVEMAAALDAQREAAAHAAAQEERTRIAREVHDAVAHSVSVMTLQVGGLRRQLGDVLASRPDERDVMLGIERLGRESVEELRSLVGILRSSADGAPVAAVPSLSRADELVADVVATGQPVELQVLGEPLELPRAVDVSAYRILQEALTNVLRHSPGSTTHVRIGYANDGVDIQVEDEGDGRPATPDSSPGGHGLVGMRERAEMFGGRLAAGPRQPRGFAVHAHLPAGRRWS